MEPGVAQGQVGQQHVVGVVDGDDVGHAAVVGVVHPPAAQHDRVPIATGAAQGHVVHPINIQRLGQGIDPVGNENCGVGLEVGDRRLELGHRVDVDDDAGRRRAGRKEAERRTCGRRD